MIIDFFGSRAAKRSKEERQKILEKIGQENTQTEDYLRFGHDYFDNPSLGVGYGGYSYDGRYQPVAAAMCEHYGLKEGSKVLEIGCAKGFVLVEFFKLGCEVSGMDISEYAVAEAHPDIASFIQLGDISTLPFGDHTFDLVLGKEVLPHIDEDILPAVIQECVRVSKGNLFFEIQCGTNKEEIDRINSWDRTHRSVKTPEWWDTLFDSYDVDIDRNYKILL